MSDTCIRCGCGIADEDHARTVDVIGTAIFTLDAEALSMIGASFEDSKEMLQRKLVEALDEQDIAVKGGPLENALWGGLYGVEIAEDGEDGH